ncbi:uncharacterized protein OCT59_026636 [Rhizophagus irregularis]|uniref:uncharacterized protein n=1 Tax=Rhizophagus irregularis TaxID=588596 RepID=UPI00331947A2|nr:hypothetical protein OCT59_026636 [Rhizophagus irregularis]
MKRFTNVSIFQSHSKFHFWLGCMDFGKIQKISFFRRRVWTSEFGDFSCRILDVEIRKIFFFFFDARIVLQPCIDAQLFRFLWISLNV